MSNDNDEKHKNQSGGKDGEETRRDANPRREDDDNRGNGAEIERTEYRISRFFSGPIPPADMLARYEEVLPGSADRLISMAERQHRFRILLSILSPTIGLASLVVLVVFALAVISFGVPTVIAALSALPPNTLMILGGLVYIWRNVDKTRMERERHSQQLQFDAENHNIDIQIKRERHELEMQIDLERHQLALRAGEERLALPDPTENNNGEDEDEDGDSEHRLSI